MNNILNYCILFYLIIVNVCLFLNVGKIYLVFWLSGRIIVFLCCVWCLGFSNVNLGYILV